jgi:hypothetical protein
MTSDVRYALLFVLAAAPLLVAGEVKPAPRAFVAALFVLHALLSARARRSQRSWPRDALTVLLRIGCLVASGMFLCTSFALRVSPPVTPDGHPVMPIGQALVGMLVGGVAGLVVATRGSLRHPRRDRGRERTVLHAVGALLLVAAVTGW